MPRTTNKGPRILALLTALTLSAAALAADSTVREYKIVVQPLDQALRQFALSTGMDLLFPPELVAGRKSSSVNGSYRTDEALAELLKGTGLQYTVSGTKIVISRAQPATEVSAAGIAKPIHMASTAEDAGAAQAAREETGDTDAQDKGVPEILVQGSRILNMDIRRERDAAQPYTIFDREAIQRSSARNAEDFLRQRLTPVSSYESRSQGANGAGQTSSIELRGLGADETLILIDGHRAAGYLFAGSPSQPDISGIPLKAIERIEVLPTTASGIYGGGATGGVINIVLRRDYSGMEAKVSYANTFRSDLATKQIDISAGFNLEEGRTTVLFAGSHSDSGDLLTNERDFQDRGRAHIMAHDSNSAFLGGGVPPLGATTNILSLSGNPLQLKTGGTLTSAFTSIPRDYAGAASDNGAQLLANAGRYNLEAANTAQGLGGGKAPLLSAPRRTSVMTTIRRRFTPSLEAFADLSASENTGTARSN